MVDFLIIGNGSLAGSANSIFELFMLKKIKYGYSISSGYRYFEVPDDYEFYGTVYKEEEGKRYIAVSGVRWFTSMRDDCPPKLVLSRKYVEGEYKKFDNFDAINIDKTKDIPVDYMGKMGVPITFLDKWNYEQFDIVGFLNNGCRFDENGLQGNNGIQMTLVGGVCKYFRLLIKRKIS